MKATGKKISQWVPFAILAILMAAPGQLAAQAQTLSFCGFQFDLPEVGQTAWQLVQNEADLIVLESRSTADIDVRARWLFSCVSNVARTSQISEIKDQAVREGQIIHSFREQTLNANVEAAVFTRTRTFEGRRVRSTEAYFATRDLEFRIFALAEPTPGTTYAATDPLLQSIMKALLDRGRFEGEVQTTISESQYRLRFYAMLVLTGLLLMGAFVLGLRWLLSRRGGRP